MKFVQSYFLYSYGEQNKDPRCLLGNNMASFPVIFYFSSYKIEIPKSARLSKFHFYTFHALHTKDHNLKDAEKKRIIKFSHILHYFFRHHNVILTYCQAT